jgi:hypothetical protein
MLHLASTIISSTPDESDLLLQEFLENGEKKLYHPTIS